MEEQPFRRPQKLLRGMGLDGLLDIYCQTQMISHRADESEHPSEPLMKTSLTGTAGRVAASPRPLSGPSVKHHSSIKHDAR